MCYNAHAQKEKKPKKCEKYRTINLITQVS